VIAAQVQKPKEGLSYRRSPMEIIGDSLDSISRAGREGLNPTKIMYKANLSWVQLERLLEMFIEAGWVTSRDETVKPNLAKQRRIFYSITEEGQRIRDDYKQLKEELMPLYRANYERDGSPGR
jgi:predicted transcriptional regulator